MASIFDLLMLGSLLEMFCYFWSETTFLSCIYTVSSRVDFSYGTPLCSGRQRKECSMSLHFLINQLLYHRYFKTND